MANKNNKELDTIDKIMAFFEQEYQRTDRDYKRNGSEYSHGRRDVCKTTINCLRQLQESKGGLYSKK